MAERGQCQVCFGIYAVAKDGTPYKHNTPDTDETCPGSDEQANPVPQWNVYGGEITSVTYPVITQQAPSTTDPLPEIDFGQDEQALALLGSFDHPPSRDEIRALMPEQYQDTLPPDPAPAPE